MFQALWEEAREIAPVSETRTRIVGVQFKMSTFSYFFGVLLGKCVLKHTNNLSRTLQSPTLSDSDAHHVANLTYQTLEKIRDDKCFDIFWEKALLLQSNPDESVVPRMRRTPRRYEIEITSVHYYEVSDLIVNFTVQRFDQPGYVISFKISSNLLRVKIFRLSLVLLCNFMGVTLIQLH